MGVENTKKRIPLLLRELFIERTDDTHYIRMPEILDYLAENGIEADRRTVYSTIELLNYGKEKEFVIEGQAERGGYKYHLVKNKFSATELKLLVDSVAGSKFLTESSARTLIQKIQGLGSIYQKETLKRDVLLGERIKRMDDITLKNLDTIYKAIAGNRQLSFIYMKWKVNKRLEPDKKGIRAAVSPFAVALDSGNYYLIAVSSYHKTIHYRIDKMKNIELLPEEREGREQFNAFNIRDYTRATFNMFGGREEIVSMIADTSLFGVFYERFGDSATIRPELKDDNMIRIRAKINVSPMFFGWIAGFGDKVEIVSPEKVADEYLKWIERIEKRYRS